MMNREQAFEVGALVAVKEHAATLETVKTAAEANGTDEQFMAIVDNAVKIAREKVAGPRWDAIKGVGNAMRPSVIQQNRLGAAAGDISATQGLGQAAAGYGAGAGALGAAGVGASMALSEPEPTGMEAIIAKLRGYLG